MYIQEVSIEINSKVNYDEVVDEFGLLMSSYRGSGQAQGISESQYISDNRICCLLNTLEKGSLLKKNDNFYVKMRTKRVEELCNSTLQFKTVGKSYSGYQSPCSCKKPNFYILVTNYTSIDSPLTCGACNLPIPLYRLPVYYDHGYKPILSWQSNYIDCDSLQMGCEVGERWALNQMQEVNSQLSRKGLKICREIERLTSIPTYYHLYNYRKVVGNELLKPCPNCGKKWFLKEKLHDLYDFKCDKCKLVSTRSFRS